jgi:hypothetical protein
VGLAGGEDKREYWVVSEGGFEVGGYGRGFIETVFYEQKGLLMV